VSTRRDKDADFALRPDTLSRLLAVLALVVLPHMLHLPLWLSALITALGAWRYAAAHHRLRLPAGGVRILLTVLVLAAIHGQYGTLLGRDAGDALLIAMLGLKLLELRENRDVYVAVFLGYFLVVVQFLYTQAPFVAVYMLAIVVLLTAVLIDLNRQRAAPPRETLRLAGGMVLYALPLMLVAFVLFPRISGPLWGLPNDAYSGLSGLSNEMAPGEISHLSLSDAVAFRVAFEGAMPTPQQRYWRGPVFMQTDGGRWRGGDEAVTAPPSFTPLGPPLTYSVTLEPHNRPWLFALDLPAAVPPGARVSPAFQLEATQTVRERRRYRLTSYPDYRTTGMSERERRRALQLPAGGNPRARARAAEWRAQARSPDDIVQAALRMFRGENFVYTLSPPRIGDDFVDGFLFDTRKGFCEHYAGSFAFLMRAAGVPARVVTGYQGGEYNELGRYLIVRQRDAHAWAEVWLAGRGWVRVDPTAAVAPERIERGIDPALQREGTAVRFTSQGEWLSALWRGGRHAWDAFNNRWNQWVLAYGPERQTDLLSWLSVGGLAWQSVAAGVLGIAGGLIVLLVMLGLKTRGRTIDRVHAAYQDYCVRLARRGLARAADEGPADYARRARRARPDLAGQIDAISDLYIALRYGKEPLQEELAALRRSVRAFHP